jgi:TetR/AcrR family acrAB operon transcriptional repressor
MGHIGGMASDRSPLSDRRLRLLDAAGSLFAQWGFDKTSVDEIAREAGISKGAVYLEFPNKEELFKAVLHAELASYMGEWLRRFERDPGDYSFAKMIQHSLAVISGNPFVKAIMTRDQRLLGSFLRRDPELISMAISVRTEFFKQMQAAGAMRDDIPAEVLAHLMSAIGYGVIAGDDVIPPRDRAPFDELLGALALLLDRGLAPPRAKNRKASREIIIAVTEQARAALRGEAPGKRKRK